MQQKIIILLIICIFSIKNSFSQTEMYLDETMKEIDITSYDKKCNSEIFKCKVYQTDSLKVNKVLFNYAFGAISHDEYNQIRLLLVKKSEIKIDSDKTLIISYSDTLYNFNAQKIIEANHLKTNDHVIPNIKSNNKPIRLIHRKLTKKKYLKIIKRREKQYAKCLETVRRKYNSEAINVYRYDTGYLKDLNTMKWIKDNGVFKGKFFNIMYQAHLIIIRPNGNYFMSGSYLSDDRLKKLLNNEDWSQFKLDWQNSIYTNSEKGIGFFERNKNWHKTHCF